MNKKYISSILLFLFFTSAQGQLSKTTWISGGEGKFKSYINNLATDQSFKEVGISARIGYFLSDGFALGLKPTVNYSAAFDKEGNADGGKVQQYLIGPFARYYFLNSEKQFNLLVEANAQIGINNLLDNGPSKSLSLYTGPVIFLNSTVGLEFLVGYAYMSEKSQGYSLTTKGFSAGIGFQIHLTK